MENRTQYTEGPWKTGGAYGNSCEEVMAGSRFVAAVRTRAGVNTKGNYLPFEEEGKANLRLVLSSPQLVMACEQAYHELRVRCGYKPGDAVYDVLGDTLVAALGQREWNHRKGVKTYTDWCASRKNLGEFFQIGDLVDRETVDYFINVLPPACMSPRCIQIGEAVRHDDETGKPMFSTLERQKEGWVYAGVKVTPDGEVCRYD